MNIKVIGSGWLSSATYGSGRQGQPIEYASRTTLRGLGKEDSLFSYRVKNFGRFPEAAQRACYITALALRDAGIEYTQGGRLDIGLIGMDEFGCEQANLDYFSDYVEGGRSLARANLFIYTLPSSPMAEAAVHFGLQGPLFYYRDQNADLESLMTTARRLIAEGQADGMAIYEMGHDVDRCYVMGRNG